MCCVIDLKIPTDFTEKGPILSYSKDKLLIEYDYKNDDKTVSWSKIEFNDVLAVQVKNSACFEEEDVLSEKTMRCMSQSAWLSRIINLWKESVGWHDWQQKQGGAERYKHYTIYFPDAGCIDVIAARFHLE